MPEAVKMFKAHDGKVFPSYHEADCHEKAVKACKKVPWLEIRGRTDVSERDAYQLFFVYFRSFPAEPQPQTGKA